MVERLAARWYVDECAVETRIARLIGHRLVSLKIIPHVMPARARAQVGDVYLARVVKSARGMRGQFLDLGEGGDGLLRTREALPEGTFIRARVVQSAYGSKLTVLKREKPAAEDTIKSGRRAGRVSAPLSAAQYIAARMQEGEKVFADGDRAWRAPPAAESAEPGLFEHEGIEAQIEAALEALVPLPCGGRLIIEHTEALTAIDVDAGSARASVANMEAAAEIPYQIAARSLAGNIVVDFAQINRASELDSLKERIATTAKGIDLNLQIGMASRTGLLEMQRPRTEAPLAALLTKSGLTHNAVPLQLNFEAQAARLARVVRVAASRLPGALDLRVGPALGDWLERGEGRAAWDAIRAASPAVLHLSSTELDDRVSVTRSERSAG